MTVKQSTIYYSLGCVLITGIFLFAVNLMCLTDSNGKGQHIETNKPYPHEKRQRPIIIWHHNLIRDTKESLKTALSSGLINHVSIGETLNRRDFDYRTNRLVAGLPQDLVTSKKVREAVAIVKRSGAKVIWMRWLWPGYEIEGIRFEDIFDPNYYIEEIRNIRAEAKSVGADFTAIDTEPYGYFPFKSEFRKRCSDKDFNSIHQAVKDATNKSGQVDFVLPSYGPFKNHIYNALVELGKWKIAEHTYFDIPAKIKDKKRPYDVMGAYLDITKHNDKYPTAPCFTPREILERQDLWAHTKGLFIYPDDENIEKIAEMFSKISDIQPETTKKSGR